MEHFGEHFMIDGYDGNEEKLNNREVVLDYINNLVKKMGMSKLAEPTVLFAPENDKKDPGGWSGFVVIAESHISIHTFPKRRFVSIDAYTCKNGLDIDFIKTNTVETFDLKEVETNFVRRGMKYPKENL